MTERGACQRARSVIVRAMKKSRSRVILRGCEKIDPGVILSEAKDLVRGCRRLTSEPTAAWDEILPSTSLRTAAAPQDDICRGCCRLTRGAFNRMGRDPSLRSG